MLSVITPTYNEAKNIELLVKEIDKVLNIIKANTAKISGITK